MIKYLTDQNLLFNVVLENYKCYYYKLDRYISNCVIINNTILCIPIMQKYVLPIIFKKCKKKLRMKVC